MIDMYKNNESYTKICDICNTNPRTLVRILQKAGVYRKGKTCIKRKCKYTINSNYFDEINDEYKAYWLGYIGADGCVMKDRYGRWYLKFHIHKKDEELLIKFKKCIESNHKIKLDKNNKHISLSISDKHLIQQLINHGIVERKSLIYKFNTSINKNLIPHYIRGYLDGDGCVYGASGNKIKNIHEAYHFVGSIYFIDYFSEYLNSLNIKHNVYFCNSKKNKQLSIVRLESVRLFSKLIYSNANIYLMRKYKLFRQFSETSTLLNHNLPETFQICQLP
jgi:hypothetical protein